MVWNIRIRPTYHIEDGFTKYRFSQQRFDIGRNYRGRRNLGEALDRHEAVEQPFEQLFDKVFVFSWVVSHGSLFENTTEKPVNSIWCMLVGSQGN